MGADYQRRPGANSSTRQARRIVPYAVGAYLGIHMDASDLADVSFHDACFSKKESSEEHRFIEFVWLFCFVSANRIMSHLSGGRYTLPVQMTLEGMLRSEIHVSE